MLEPGLLIPPSGLDDPSPASGSMDSRTAITPLWGATAVFGLIDHISTARMSLQRKPLFQRPKRGYLRSLCIDGSIHQVVFGEN